MRSTRPISARAPRRASGECQRPNPEGNAGGIELRHQSQKCKKEPDQTSALQGPRGKRQGNAGGQIPKGMPEAQSRRECRRPNPEGNAGGPIPIWNSEDPLLWGFGKLSARICEVLPGHDQRPLPAGVHISAKQYRQRKSTILWAYPGL